MTNPTEERPGEGSTTLPPLFVTTRFVSRGPLRYTPAEHRSVVSHVVRKSRARNLVFAAPFLPVHFCFPRVQSRVGAMWSHCFFSAALTPR